MAVPRLTDEIKYAPHPWNKCQLCGHTSNDICTFRMWQECDEQDKPEPGNVFIVCRGDNDDSPCQKKIDDHPRCYQQVPWGMGEPGQFMLLCGDCPNRAYFTCGHAHMKKNGGEGILVELSNPFGASVRMHGMNPETGELERVHFAMPTPAVACEGHPTKKPRTQG